MKNPTVLAFMWSCVHHHLGWPLMEGMIIPPWLSHAQYTPGVDNAAGLSSCLP